MQPKEKHNSDLDYLSEAGFELVSTSDADMTKLEHRLRKRVKTAKFGSKDWFSAGGILIFLSVTVFFTVYNRETIYPTFASEEKPASEVTSLLQATNMVSLDTILVSDNFTRPVPNKKKQLKDTLADEEALRADTLSVAGLQPQPFSAVEKGREEALKPIENSNIIYLHDLKITDYNLLYFKRNIADNLKGIPAAYAEHEGNAGSRLRTGAKEYLHDKIAHAMFLFKSGRYDECLLILRDISTYNSKDVNCSFYSGMCLFYKKNYRKAVTYFEECLDQTNNTFVEEALYYRAVSQYYSGEKEAGLSSLKRIAEGTMFYSDKATAFLAGIEN